MTQTSYPITGEEFTNAQWRTVLAALGDGIIRNPADANPYGLSLSAVNNEATVLAAADSPALLGGHLHVLSANEVLELAAAVGSPVTYRIALCLDPGDYAAAGGPITLVAYTGDADVTGGKTYLPLWDVTRSPGETLDQATTTDLRLSVAPTLRVGSSLPDATLLPLFTRCLVNASTTDAVEYLNRELGGGWVNLDDPPWSTLSLVSGYVSATTLGGIYTGYNPPQRRIRRGRVELRGQIAKASGFASGGAMVAVLPSGYRPERMMQFPTATTYTSGKGTGGRCEIFPDGTMKLWAISTWETRWWSLDGISYQAVS